MSINFVKYWNFKRRR